MKSALDLHDMLDKGLSFAEVIAKKVRKAARAATLSFAFATFIRSLALQRDIS
jgi:hypothetical protein